ncbi:MAG: hypothetical protein PSX81_00845 [bacterium]|nr:hypothetical protein [bacterium]
MSKQFKTIFFLSISFVLCAFNAKQKTCDFKLISATKMVMMGGAAGSPTITQYKITLKVQRSFTFIGDSAFAEGRMDRLTIISDTSANMQNIKLKRGQLLHLTFSIVQASDNGNNNTGLVFSSSPLAAVPIASKSGVVIRYRNGQRRYFNIVGINTQLPVYAP